MIYKWCNLDIESDESSTLFNWKNVFLIIFLKMSQTRPRFHLFLVFSNFNTIFTRNQCDKINLPKIS